MSPDQATADRARGGDRSLEALGALILPGTALNAVTLALRIAPVDRFFEAYEHFRSKLAAICAAGPARSNRGLP